MLDIFKIDPWLIIGWGIIVIAIIYGLRYFVDNVVEWLRLTRYYLKGNNRYAIPDYQAKWVSPKGDIQRYTNGSAPILVSAEWFYEGDSRHKSDWKEIVDKYKLVEVARPAKEICTLKKSNFLSKDPAQ